MLKYAYLIDVAIPNIHNLHSTVTDKFQKYTELEKRAYKKMTTENHRYNTNSTIHRYNTNSTIHRYNTNSTIHIRCYYKQITRKFKTA
jgi:hypothetical protein